MGYQSFIFKASIFDPWAHWFSIQMVGEVNYQSLRQKELKGNLSTNLRLNSPFQLFFNEPKTLRNKY
jgi:hypothetical protein